MTIYQALYSGVNGINANGAVTALIGDNISNVNTTGYKSSRAEFSDIVAGSSQIAGMGSRVAGTTQQFSQGGFEATSSVTDLAIDGQGFFEVNDFVNQRYIYTRAGQFIVDEDGYVVNLQGHRLRGFGVDENNSVTSEQVDFQFSYEPNAPNSTDNVTVAANLTATAATPAAFDAADPINTSNYSAGVTVYDSLGSSHLLTLYYRNNGAAGVNEQWEWYAVCDSDDITGATTAQIEASGTLLFNPNGALISTTELTNDFDFVGATQDQSITFDFGTVLSASSTGLDGITQFGGDSSLTSITQDGYASGILNTIEIGTDGTISGTYTNGQRLTLGQVGIALFADNQALQRMGHNAWDDSLTSGVPLLAIAESGGRGAVLSSTLEQSNVDLANELIKLVIIQRGFQANTRTISVVNELLGSLVSLGG
ncbi:MAG: flagellar hook protein FlgE [Deltaproteobacteria bacterium]|nr:flagellar hook protein FlgE [Deltaproteobacteria bacterium]